MRCVVSCGSTSFLWLVFFFGALLWGSWFTSIQEDGCDKGVYLGTERYTPVIPNWFQPCQCCSSPCYPGEYLRLGTFISYNRAQVLEACDRLKLLSIYFHLCVDATGVVINLVFSAPKTCQGSSPPCNRNIVTITKSHPQNPLEKKQYAKIYYLGKKSNNY